MLELVRGETTGLAAQTLHRLLETDPKTGGFKRDAARPLEADAVVLDETSMVDVRLMYALTKAIPDAAALIVACRDASVPFKATAGLHHPIRHYDDGLDTEMHGFLNIFAAAVRAAEHRLDRTDVQTILREENADNFRFLKDAVAWRDLTVSLDGVRHARDTLALSFGSCSFEEPIDHLRDLELL